MDAEGTRRPSTMIRSSKLVLSGAVLASLALTSACAPPTTQPAAELPTVSFAAKDQKVSEGVGTVSIPVSLSAKASADVSVPFSVGGTATTDDHGLVAGTLTIKAGETGGHIDVPVKDDALYEAADETVTVTLGTPVGAKPGAITAFELTIEDNDALPKVQFTAATQQVGEDAGEVTVEAELSGPSAQEVMVSAQVAGTATSADHDLVDARFVFAAGETKAQLKFHVIDDAIDEDDETVELTLGTPVNAASGDETKQVITIADNDAPPTVAFAAATQAVSEKDGLVSFTVQLSGPSSFDVSVPFTVGGTATAADHDLVAGTVTIPAGQTHADVTFHVLDETLHEADETVLVTLGTPTRATLGETSGLTLTITDDDPVPSVALTTAAKSVSEAVGTELVTVQLSNPSAFPIAVPYTVAGSATGDDFALSEGTISIAPGETAGAAPLVVKNDAFHEESETVVIGLVNPIGAVPGSITEETITIADDDDVAQLASNIVRFSAKSLDLADGAPVSAWQDVGPRGLVASQPEASLQPTFVADAFTGQPAVHFSGANQLVTAPTQLFSQGLSPLTVVAVIRSSDAAPEGTLLHHASSGTACGNFGFTQNTGSSEFGIDGDCDGDVGSNGYAPRGKLQLATAVIKSSGAQPDNVAMFRNGLPLTMSAVSNGFGAVGTYPTGTAPLELGARAGNAGLAKAFTGDVAEIAVYAAELTDAERHQVECFLGGRYGIAVQGCVQPCADLKAQGQTEDGEYVVAVPGAGEVSIYCHDMANTPKEFLTLAHTGEVQASGGTVGANCFSDRAGGFRGGTDVTTCYDRVRIDVATLLVDRDDKTFARSGGNVSGITSMPYATVGNCDWTWSNAGKGLVDLGGIPFAVDDRVSFSPQGWAPYGGATISSDRKTVTLFGGGQCGDESPDFGLLYLKPAAP